MPNKKKFQLLGLVLNILVIILTIVTAVVVLGFANGYRVDYRNFRIEKVGALIINATPSIVTLKVDEDTYEINALTNIISLSPGRYELVVSRSGYKNWVNSVRIESGQGVLFDDIFLFLENPELITERQATPREVEDAVPNPSLKYENGELRLITEDEGDDTLVTRLSREILAAQLIDDNHIVFQVGQELRVIEVSGSNDTIILNLGSEDPVKLMSRQNGTILRIIDQQGLLKEYRIR